MSTQRATEFDQLVSLLRLLLVPFVYHAGESASFLDGLAGVCRAGAKNKKRCGQGS